MNRRKLITRLWLCVLIATISLIFTKIVITAFPFQMDIVDEIIDNSKRGIFELGLSLHAWLTWLVIKASPDLFLAFYLRQFLLILLSVCVLFWFAKTYNLPKIFTLVMCLWAILGPISIYADSTEFAFLLAMCGCGCFKKLNAGRNGWAAFFVFMLAAVYVRREYSIGIALGVVFYAFTYIETRWRRPIPWFYSVLAILAVPLVLLTLGDSMGSASPMWFAFAQHFSVFYQERFQIAGNPWVEWERISKISFPNSHRLREALVENPQMFFWFIKRKALISLPSGVLRLFSIPLLQISSGKIAELANALVTSSPVWGLIFVGLKKKYFKLPEAEARPMLALLGIPFSAVIITAPTVRHLFPLLPIIIVLAGQTISCPQINQNWKKSWNYICSVILVTAVIALAFNVFDLHLNIKKIQSENTKDILAQKSTFANSSEHLVILSAFLSPRLCELNRNPFCEPLSLSTLRLPPDTKLAQYLHDKKVSLIFADGGFFEHSLVKSDETLRQILESPNQFGVTKITTREGAEIYFRGDNQPIL